MTGILLIESNKHLRENVALNLTTTGGYQVYHFPSFISIPSVKVELALFPGNYLDHYQQSPYANLPYILTTSGKGSKKCLGKVLIQQLPVQVIAEKVRVLVESRAC